MNATSRLRRFFPGSRPGRNTLLLAGAGLIVGALVWPHSDATLDRTELGGARQLTLPTAPGVPTSDATLGDVAVSARLDADALRQAALGADKAPALPRPQTSAPRAATDEGPVATGPSEPAVAPAAEWKVETVRNGDNLAAVFKRAGLTPRDVHEVVNAEDPADQLTRIFPGDEIYLQITPDGELVGLRYAMDETRTLHLNRDDHGELAVRVETITLERRVAETQGRIESSLYNAGLAAGLDDRLIMELAGIFGWDIDFALDLRRNDSFVVVYETLHRDGRKVRNGDILAAEFVNRGERFRALRYETAEGESDYYTPEGRSMRRAFLRTPTDFTRVSSEFNPNRLHPIYGTKRPHRGTDYAAPPGTPIKAAGDGKIIERGRKGGYGNTVVLKHGTRYTTLYGHMRGFAKGQSVGDRVSQGEIIGYVGSTGLSTGPHLHYEFRVDGVHRNPRTVDLPEAEPIAERYRADFERSTADLVAQLDSLTRTRIAQAGE
ncbi:OapA family protein [Spiribacter onubensis]|uniref:Peptidoglycan DD-metalloendopeptidase family protein n=1 Tax=Spiribacter onubensis TaxID=3122420 RepID=A0ABV3SAU4_9GAMM